MNVCDDTDKVIIIKNNKRTENFLSLSNKHDQRFIAAQYLSVLICVRNLSVITYYYIIYINFVKKKKTIRKPDNSILKIYYNTYCVYNVIFSFLQINFFLTIIFYYHSIIKLFKYCSYLDTYKRINSKI